MSCSTDISLDFAHRCHRAVDRWRFEARRSFATEVIDGVGRADSAPPENSAAPLAPDPLMNTPQRSPVGAHRAVFDRPAAVRDDLGTRPSELQLEALDRKTCVINSGFQRAMSRRWRLTTKQRSLIVEG